MVVTIHQPEHLPWLGFCHKAAQADLLVLLDVVQFRKNYFQNRNRVMGPNGPVWLTVPVLLRGHTDGTIADIEINNGVEWRRKHWRTLVHGYGRHPFFGSYAPFFEALYAREWRRLAALNEEIIRYLFEGLGIMTKVLRASDLGVRGKRSELLRDICLATGATTYLAGQSGPQYLDESLFQAAGLGVRYHAFAHPEYPQQGRDGFVSHLSVVDLLFNCGPRSLEIIRSVAPA